MNCAAALEANAAASGNEGDPATPSPLHWLARGGAALLVAAIACAALRQWLEPSSAVALLELFSLCR